MVRGLRGLLGGQIDMMFALTVHAQARLPVPGTEIGVVQRPDADRFDHCSEQKFKPLLGTPKIQTV